MDRAITQIANLYDGNGVALYALIVVAFATVLTGLIGFEREKRGYSAGLRTHILVGLGSCLFMLVSMFAFRTVETDGTITYEGDPERIAAQVVTGIGFIGAGTILQNGISVKGLTTAATLWVAGAIGLCCGAGLVLEAIITTVVALFVLILLKLFEDSPKAKGLVRIVYVCHQDEKTLAKVMDALDGIEIKIKDIDVKTCIQDGEKCTKVILSLKIKNREDIVKAMDALMVAVKPIAMEELK